MFVESNFKVPDQYLLYFHFSNKNKKEEIPSQEALDPILHHRSMRVKKIAITALCIFCSSILLWAIGAETGVTGLRIIGQTGFGLCLSAFVLGVIAFFVLLRKQSLSK